MNDQHTSLLALAQRYFRAEQYPQALATLRFASVAYGQEPERDRLLGACAQKCGEDALAAQAYERALPEFPKDVALLVNLAEVYLHQAQLLRAATLLARVIRIEPTVRTAAGLRARVLVLRTRKQLGS